MQRSRSGGTLLERARLGTENVFRAIGLLNLTSIPVVEVAKAARANFAAMNIICLERLGLEIRILSGLRKHTRNATLDGANLYQFLFLIAMDIGRVQRICAALRLKIDMRHITVAHLIVKLGAWHLGAAEAQHRVLLGRLRALNIRDVHDVSRLIAELLANCRLRARNIGDIHLVTNELGRFGRLKFGVLQVV